MNTNLVLYSGLAFIGGMVFIQALQSGFFSNILVNAYVNTFGYAQVIATMYFSKYRCHYCGKRPRYIVDALRGRKCVDPDCECQKTDELIHSMYVCRANHPQHYYDMVAKFGEESVARYTNLKKPK